MGLGDWAGRARANPRSPLAMAECDRCGFWYPLDRLQKQFEWRGAQLAWTGYLVCPDRCLDVPFEQNKVLILPVDPRPRVNPRPSWDTTAPFYPGQTAPTSPQNQGMTQLDLTTGASIAGMYPTTKADVLAAVASLTGIPTPTFINDQSIVITQGIPQQALLANPGRVWMLLYNPTQQNAEFCLGNGAWNGTLNLSIGPGEAWFWSNSQNLTPVYVGIVTAIGQYSGLALWCWDAVEGVFGDDGGVLYIMSPPATYPTGPFGLPPGSIYTIPDILPNGAFALGVVAGVVPNPAAPPVFFSGLTAPSLLALGGGNLPLSPSGLLPQQLWNDGGLIAIAIAPFGSDGGVMFTHDMPPGYQIGPVGLPAGAVYLVPDLLSGGNFAVGVVPGEIPQPSAPPLYLYSTSTAELLATGGNNLPLTNPGVGTQQLWNNGGLISVS